MNLNHRNLVIVPLFVVAAALGACERGSAPTPPADNTATNVRDRDGATVLPSDQGESEADRQVTAEARQAVVASNLSTNAKNCKIITRSGVVTLRGPVDSTTERSEIEAIVRRVPGVQSVVNELDVAAPR